MKGESPLDHSAFECDVVFIVSGSLVSRDPMILIMFIVLWFDRFGGCGLS